MSRSVWAIFLTAMVLAIAPVTGDLRTGLVLTKASAQEPFYWVRPCEWLVPDWANDPEGHARRLRLYPVPIGQMVTRVR